MVSKGVWDKIVVRKLTSPVLDHPRRDTDSMVCGIATHEAITLSKSLQASVFHLAWGEFELSEHPIRPFDHEDPQANRLQVHAVPLP